MGAVMPRVASTLETPFAGVVKRLGVADYEVTWQAMREFTRERTADTPDEIWLLQHPPVFTVGVAGRSEHLPRSAQAIPVIQVDRGGQITYHGPGQWIAYCLLDMRRLGIVTDSLRQSFQARKVRGGLAIDS